MKAKNFELKTRALELHTVHRVDCLLNSMHVYCSKVEVWLTTVDKRVPLIKFFCFFTLHGCKSKQ
jgi:hypothetical protein